MPSFLTAIDSTDTTILAVVQHNDTTGDIIFNVEDTVSAKNFPDTLVYMGDRPPTTYTIDTTGSNIHGTVTVSPGVTGLTPGTWVIFTATPDSGYAFSSWTGNADLTTAIDSFQITENSTIYASFVAVPILDSVRAKVRRGVALSDCRVGDTVYFYYRNQADSGTTSALRLNSTGTIMATVIAWGYPVTAIIPNGTPRGYYRPRLITVDGIFSPALTSNALYVKVPNIGSY
jgi:hypothetical protein